MAKSKKKTKLNQQHHYTNKGYTMKFGQYRGQLIQTVPRDYIDWAAANITDPTLRLKFRAEIAWRDWIARKQK